MNDPDGVHVDDDRTCDAATDYVNTIQIGPGQALLLGEEIPAMYWVAAADFVGGYLVTWIYLAEGELPDLRELLAALPAATFHATAYTVTCAAQGFYLFPATNAPMDGEHFNFIEVRLPAGTYGATLGFYETLATSLRFVKIQRQGA